MKATFNAICVLIIFALLLIRADRVFFKNNNSFSVRFLFSSLSPEPSLDLPRPTEQEIETLDEALKQKFRYLGKGAHCYAFVSEDNQYVIKFHRFASHMRILPWLNHPFAYSFKEHRKKIKAHNEEKLLYNLSNYKNSYADLKEETGALFLHLNKTNTLHRTATLIDTMGFEYKVNLDHVTFILQHKAELIYPTLARYMSDKKIEEAKQVISSILELMKLSCQKGYADNDPMLHKNHGLLGNKAIHIDMGDLVKQDELKSSKVYIPYIQKITSSLQDYLESHYPELLPYYHETMRSL